MPNDAKPPASIPRKTFLHVYSGIAVLGLDWLLFSGNLITAGTATALTSLLGFVLGTCAVAACQRIAAHDAWLASLVKGLASGVVVAIPFPIAGTFLGGAVLTLSGLSSLKKRPPVK